MTIITIGIIIVTAVVSVLGFSNHQLFDKLKFNAYMVYHKKEWQRMIMHGFLHADWMHLIFNMLTLYFFGGLVEMYFKAYLGTWSNAAFTLFYVGAIVVSSIFSLIKHKNHTYYNAVGASGAVSAILFASVLFDPWNGIYLFFIPIPIPAIIFAPLYLFYSYYMSKKNIDNVGHDAHFWGAIFGLICPILMDYRILFGFFAQLFGIN